MLISPPKVVEDAQRVPFALTGLLGQSREETRNHSLAEDADTPTESRRITPSAQLVEEVSKASFVATGLLCQSREPLKGFEISTCIPFRLSELLFNSNRPQRFRGQIYTIVFLC